jgi:putative acetyltransferase
VSWSIRGAEPADRDGILEVVRAAFSAPDRDAHEELDIVLGTWSREARPQGLELVATDGPMLIGHVLAAKGDLADRAVLGIAPLSVMPHRQGQGIGTALLTELLRRTDQEGWPLVVLLGDPRYYRRFGFEPAGPFGIVYQPVGSDSPYFQVRWLNRVDPSLRGQFRYCWEDRRE